MLTTSFKIIVPIIFGLTGFLLSFFISGDPEVVFISTFYSIIGSGFIFPFLDTNWRLNLTCGVKGIAFIKLAIRVINADGETKDKEIEKLTFYMQNQYGDSILKPLSKFFEENKNLKESIAQICKPLEDIGKSKQVEIFYRLFMIAAADKIFSENEEVVLKEIAKGLYIEEKRFTIIKKSILKEKGYKYGSERQHDQQNHSWNYYVLDQMVRLTYNPFAVLGLEHNASIDEVKQAYRKLAKLYHPDKSIKKNEAQRKQDAGKILEINEAYESIKKMRGIK